MCVCSCGRICVASWPSFVRRACCARGGRSGNFIQHDAALGLDDLFAYPLPPRELLSDARIGWFVYDRPSMPHEVPDLHGGWGGGRAVFRSTRRTYVVAASTKSSECGVKKPKESAQCAVALFRGAAPALALAASSNATDRALPASIAAVRARAHPCPGTSPASWASIAWREEA